MKQHLLLLATGIIAVLGLFALLHEGITGNAARRTQAMMYAMPSCPDGCWFGDAMTLKTDAGYVTLWKKELDFPECWKPEKNGCIPDRTILFPSAYQGAHTPYVLTCVNHHWEFSTGIAPPCPPQLPKLG